ncbi:MAG: COR domain-containing protein [Mariniphaga sp.]
MKEISLFKFEDLIKLESTKPPKIENGVLTFKKDENLEFITFLDSEELKEIRFESGQSKLRYLDLSYTAIRKISFNCECPNLQSITIHGSTEKSGDLRRFEILVNLPMLKLLDLSHNKYLKEITISVDLPELKFLYLGGCGLRDLQNLASYFVRDHFDFTIDKNDYLKSPPIEIAKQGKKAIINYFKSIYKSEKIEFDYLFEAKLILVGEERAGKSTIAKALSQEDFEIDLNEKSTEGIDVLKWMVPKQDAKTDKDFRFNIWDFGGQEVYHATHQFFLTKRSLYLFVTEARKDLRFDDFYYWLNIINTLAGKSPVILVQNKTDQSHNEPSIEPYQKAYPQIWDGLQKVCCNTQHEQWNEKHCHTIGSLKSTIFDILRKRVLEGIGDKLPVSWVEIRKEIADLQAKKLNYIGIEDYYKICETKGLDKERALFLSDYFHDLGVFLHFRNDVNLRNTIFLNYEWVTKGIYNVFDNAKIKNVTFGQFTDEDLISIWDEPQFKGKEPELLNLMKNEEFKICYQHRKGYYLAPQLFSDKVVAYEWRTNTSNLVFRYNYKFMPKGILSQLIVMLHKYIYKDTFWKYGVLFEHKNTRAIVTENRLENKNIIEIKVEGDGKRDLLRLIGEKIEEINESYTNLVCDEEFACNCVECEKSENKHYFNLKTINNFINKKRKYLVCSNSAEEVEINCLLGYYIPQEQLMAYENGGTTNITKIYGNNNFVGQDIKRSIIN